MAAQPADTTIIVFSVQPGNMDGEDRVRSRPRMTARLVVVVRTTHLSLPFAPVAFLAAYKAGPFTYLSKGGHVKAYTVSANAETGKAYCHIVFTSSATRDTVLTGPAWDAVVAPVRAVLAGPPDVSAGELQTRQAPKVAVAQWTPWCGNAGTTRKHSLTHAHARTSPKLSAQRFLVLSSHCVGGASIPRGHVP